MLGVVSGWRGEALSVIITMPAFLPGYMEEAGRAPAQHRASIHLSYLYFSYDGKRYLRLVVCECCGTLDLVGFDGGFVADCMRRLRCIGFDWIELGFCMSSC